MAAIRGNKTELAKVKADFLDLVGGKLKAKNMCQRDLARMTQTTEATISRKMQRPETLTIHTLLKWAAALDITVTELARVLDRNYKEDKQCITVHIAEPISWSQFIERKTEASSGELQPLKKSPAAQSVAIPTM